MTKPADNEPRARYNNDSVSRLIPAMEGSFTSCQRRDSKGRILRTGESQRKDGRYAYKYTDACGKTQFVYAWKLVPTDKTPTGKRDDISLREKVKEILRDLNDGIDTIGKKMTVCQLYARQNSHRKNVKRSTEKGREYLMSVLKSDPWAPEALTR